MSGLGPVQRQFGRTAAAYVDSATHARGEDLERVVALAREHGGERLVDVGTGVGHTLRRLAPSFRTAVGIDATREMLDAGVSLLSDGGVANAVLVQADATALPIGSAVADVVTSRLAAHHFADAPGAFREIARILRPGGLFVLVDNFAPDDRELDRFINELERLRDPSHVRNHTIRGWREEVERVGLRTAIESDVGVTRLETDGWLARSQTPPERAAEVRRRLGAAAPAAVEAFGITPTTFMVRKLILTGLK
jgi:SAM-dependent methyltransferase